jgi:hypothetical protein
MMSSMAHIQFEDIAKQHQQAPYASIYILLTLNSGFLSVRDLGLQLGQKRL